jgi:putative heme-binding domain-containing protein
VAARGNAEEIARLISRASEEARESAEGAAWWRAAVLEGLAEGARGEPAATKAIGRMRPLLLGLALHRSPDVRRGAIHLLDRTGGLSADAASRELLAQAQRTALDTAEDVERRVDAIALLALDRGDRPPPLRSLVEPSQPDRVQTAAVRALARRSAGADLGRFLLSRWAGFTPMVRAEAAGALLRESSSARLLVEAIGRGEVKPWALSFWHKRDLLMHDDEGIRTAARTVLEEDPRERQETLRRYATALSNEGDAARGEAVFRRACAACHSFGGGAGALGPDLATVRHRPPLLLLADILSPSLSIAQNHETYVVERATGKAETGVLAAQTPTSVTLRQGPGREITIARGDIRRLTALPESAMPADLDKTVSPEEMADLLAFIKAGRAN